MAEAALTPPFELTLQPESIEASTLTIDASQPLTLQIEQQFADIVVEIPALELVVDSPTSDGGYELLLITASAAELEVILRPFSPPTAQARITVQAQPAPPVGTTGRAAWDSITRAGQIFSEGKASQLLLARQLYFAASGHFRQAGYSTLAGHAHFNAAATSRLLEDYELARRLYGQIIAGDFDPQDHFLMARSHHMRGIMRSHQGNHVGARDDYRQAEQLYQRINQDRRVADVQVDRCWVEASLGAETQARACLQQLEQRLLPLGDHLRLVSTATNLAMAMTQNRQFEQAEAAYARALAYAAAGPMQTSSLRLAAANAQANRASLRHQLGQRRAALIDLLTALQIFIELDNQRQQSRVFRDVARIYTQMGYHTLAEALLDWAHARYQAAGLITGAVSVRHAGAILAADRGQSDRARRLLQEAEDIIDTGEAPILQASNIVTAARICLTLEDPACARRVLEPLQTLLAEAVEQPSLRPNLHLIQSFLALQQGQLQAAAEQAQLALDNAATPVLRAESLLLLGQAMDRGDAEKQAVRETYARALAALRTATDAFLLPGQARVDRRVREHLLGAHISVFDGTADQLVEILHLIQDLNESPLPLNPDEPATAARREQAAATLSAQLHDQGDIRKVLTSLLEIETALAQPDTPLPQPVGIDEIQAYLKADDQLMVYILGDRQSLALSIGKQDWAWRHLPPRQRILAAAGAWREALAGRSPKEHDLAGALGAILLPDSLCCRPSGRILFHEAGELAHVPLAALLPTGSERRLIEERDSARLVSLRPRHPNGQSGELGFVAVGDPVFDADDPRLPDTVAVETVPPLGRLAGTELEWSAATSSQPDRVLTGFAASKSAVMRTEVLNARTIHLATHAIGDDRYGIGSGFFLSRYQQDGQRSDGFVSALEIATRRIGADLVVLSACDTGNAESGLTLADAFLRGGSRFVVASLWPISNRATRSLMHRFYELLQADHDNTGAALRAAQRAISSQGPWAHPYYWAAFELHAYPALIRAAEAD